MQQRSCHRAALFEIDGDYGCGEVGVEIFKKINNNFYNHVTVSQSIYKSARYLIMYKFKLSVPPVIIIGIALSACSGGGDDADALQKAVTVYSINKTVGKAYLEKLTCENAANTLYNTSNTLVFNWAEKKNEKWHEYQHATASCERNTSYVSMGMCFKPQVESKTTTSVEAKSGKITLLSEPLTVGNKRNSSCVYKKQAPLKLNAVVTGEMWSEGDCGNYNQERAPAKLLVCEIPPRM